VSTTATHRTPTIDRCDADRTRPDRKQPIKGAVVEAEPRMDDGRAVMEAAGWERAVIWGVSEGRL
jgi:hypothetical protein